MHKSIVLFTPIDHFLDKAKNLKLDSVFLSYSNLSGEAISKIRNIHPNAKVYTTLDVFAGQDLLDEFPDAAPVEASGKPTSRDWYVGVCPTHEGVRNKAIERAQALLAFNIDGLWLDNIRYPTEWEDPQPYILDTCYCNRCLKKFEEFIEEPIEGVGDLGNELENTALYIEGSYYHEWLEFKTGVINSMMADIRAALNKDDFDLGAFIVPWEDKDHGAAIVRVLGQDFAKMSQEVDILSPKLYFKKNGETPEWVGEFVGYMWNFGTKFLPFVQADDLPETITPQELTKALENATKSPSMGVSVFNLDAISQNQNNFDVVKKFFDTA